MIFNMVGGGGGSGATLVVSSPANVSVTVSKGDKSYTKNSGSLGSSTFKGLATGTWTVTISGNGQTATKTIEITADYAITIAFFSATINVTYPANSTCVVTNSGGQTVASDTNATSSEKTWTATVNATGTYTITATSTIDGSKTKSATVSITADGQSESVTLTYELVLFDNGAYADETGGWSSITNNKLNVSTSSTSMSGNPKHVYTKNPVDLSDYTTLHFILDSTSSSRDQWRKAGVSDTNTGSFNANVEINNSSAIGEHTLDISTINKSQYIHLACDAWPSQNGAYASTSMVISKVWLS